MKNFELFITNNPNIPREDNIANITNQLISSFDEGILNKKDLALWAVDFYTELNETEDRFNEIILENYPETTDENLSEDDKICNFIQIFYSHNMVEELLAIKNSRSDRAWKKFGAAVNKRNLKQQKNK